jgi:GNAT superfamily N-acetyltransferase
MRPVGAAPQDDDMAWFMTDDLAEYVAAAGGFLRSRPADNTVPLTVLEVLRNRGGNAFGDAAPRFGWWQHDDGDVCGAFLVTPPYPLLLTPVPPQSLDFLAETLAQAGTPLTGVNGEPAAAEGFAAAWCKRTGATAETSMRQRLFRLAELRPPTPAPSGQPRAPRSADRDLLVAWWAAFAQESGAVDRDHDAAVDDRLSYGGLTLWEARGQPVSFAGLTRQVAGMTRVGPVYTPPHWRRHGYGAGVTAAVSARALREGAREVLLFTDLANPTSNALYQRLGYQPVHDRLVLSFTS